jgi:hypothetical protein
MCNLWVFGRNVNNNFGTIFCNNVWRPDKGQEKPAKTGRKSGEENARKGFTNEVRGRANFKKSSGFRAKIEPANWLAPCRLFPD